MVTAVDMPRALNDPVGFRPSSLMKTFGFSRLGDAAGQIFGVQLPFQAGKIVADIEHSAIFGADVLRAIRGEMVSTAGAFKVENSHRGKDSILAVGS